MANRYWVGGTASWDGTAGTKWALTSGGAGGQAIPTSADDVFLDANSGANTVTIATGNTGCKSINCTGFTGTLGGSAAITISGNITLGSGMTRTYTGTMTVNATSTITSNGITLGALTISGSGITVQLADAISCAGVLTLTQGTFNAVTYNVTCSNFNSSNSNTRTLTMGSGLWTMSGTGTVWNMTTITGLTFNKNTANILISSNSTSSRTFAGGNLSYNKFTIGGSATSTFNFQNNDSFTELASTKTVAHTIVNNTSTGVTIDVWSVTGSPGNVVIVNSSAAGVRRTYNITNSTAGINYLAVQDINISQPNKFYVGANSTDNGNNINVIFSSAPSIGVNNFLLLFI